MIDQSFVGYQLRPIEYEVCREKIREYVEAIGDPNPMYRDREAARRLGYSDVVAPPTFAAAFSALPMRAMMADAELMRRMGIDPALVVHGSQCYQYTRPLQAGDQLLVDARIDEIYQKRDMGFVVIKADVRDAAGKPVLASITTLIVRGAGK